MILLDFASSRRYSLRDWASGSAAAAAVSSALRLRGFGWFDGAGSIRDSSSSASCGCCLAEGFLFFAVPGFGAGFEPTAELRLPGGLPLRFFLTSLFLERVGAYAGSACTHVRGLIRALP